MTLFGAEAEGGVSSIHKIHSAPTWSVPQEGRWVKATSETIASSVGATAAPCAARPLASEPEHRCSVGARTRPPSFASSRWSLTAARLPQSRRRLDCKPKLCVSGSALLERTLKPFITTRSFSSVIWASPPTQTVATIRNVASGQIVFPRAVRQPARPTSPPGPSPC